MDCPDDDDADGDMVWRPTASRAATRPTAQRMCVQALDELSYHSTLLAKGRRLCDAHVRRTAPSLATMDRASVGDFWQRRASQHTGGVKEFVEVIGLFYRNMENNGNARPRVPRADTWWTSRREYRGGH